MESANELCYDREKTDHIPGSMNPLAVFGVPQATTVGGESVYG